jgi:hypothetical protein
VLTVDPAAASTIPTYFQAGVTYVLSIYNIWEDASNLLNGITPVDVYFEADGTIDANDTP